MTGVLRRADERYPRSTGREQQSSTRCASISTGGFHDGSAGLSKVVLQQSRDLASLRSASIRGGPLHHRGREDREGVK